MNLQTTEKFPILYIKEIEDSVVASSYDALLDLFLVLTPLVAWQIHTASTTGDSIGENRCRVRFSRRNIDAGEEIIRPKQF